MNDALLSEDEARTRVLRGIVRLPTSSVPLLQALGRFTAKEGRATQALPGFDNSSMDGYAVAARSPLSAGTRLAVTGLQPAGRSLGLTVADGGAIRIFTGAPIPAGTGAVVMQEDVERIDDEIVLSCEVKLGEFIRLAGSDVARGQKILEPGDKLTAQRLGLLASQGMASVEVCRPARVAILATGDELRAPGEALAAGEIYESNNVLLAALATTCGADVTTLPRAADDLADLDAKLAAGLSGHDVLIIAGGVSVGDRDFVKARLARAGVKLDLWRIAVQPGKPFLYGSIIESDASGQRTVHVFGLPGNPVSAFVTFLLFVRPALLKLMGAGDAELTLPSSWAVAGTELVNKGSRPHYLRGSVDEGGHFRCSGRQESHALFGLSRSNALVRVEPGTTVAVGAILRAFWIA